MVKIALQVSGRLRYTEASLGSMIGAITERWKPDVFGSFWNNENPETLQQWIKHLQPVSIETEDQATVRPYLDLLFPYNVHVNMPSMCYKFHRVAALRQGYEALHGFRYDIVIQARSDNVFFERLEDQVLLPLEQPGIYCANGSINPSIDPYISPRMVDNFYLGDARNMDLAAKTFWHLRARSQNYTEQGLLHQVRIPEIIQSSVWNDLGIPIRPLPGTNPFGNFHYDIDRQETTWK
jgi:hypothetical protein